MIPMNKQLLPEKIDNNSDCLITCRRALRNTFDNDNYDNADIIIESNVLQYDLQKKTYIKTLLSWLSILDSNYRDLLKYVISCEIQYSTDDIDYLISLKNVAKLIDEFEKVANEKKL